LIIDKYKRLEEQFDFVLLREPALAVKGYRTRYECSYSQKIWDSNDNCGLGVGKTLEELVDSLYLAYDSLK
jgi:phosphate acetyltransferase